MNILHQQKVSQKKIFILNKQIFKIINNKYSKVI